MATTLFSSQIPTLDKTQFMVDLAPMAATDSPVLITQSEYMRRMKEMAQFQPGMSFYGEMPDAYNLTLNTDHPLIKKLIDDAVAATEAELKPINEERVARKIFKPLGNIKKKTKRTYRRE